MDEFETDDENMSLAILMALSSDLSLLQSYVNLYLSFNARLGDRISGPRHKGHLRLISNTLDKIEMEAAQLRYLRDEKARGTPEPGHMERAAAQILHDFITRKADLWSIMDEKVDMTDAIPAANWVERKNAIVDKLIGKISDDLNNLENDRGKISDVEELKEAWIRRWDTYAEMSTEDLFTAGWIRVYRADHGA